MKELFVLHLGAALIGVTKAGFGGGTGVVVAPLLVMVLPAPQALGLMLPLLFATDVMALIYYRGQWETKALRGLVPAAVAGIAAGAALMRHLDAATLSRIIGGAALIFAIVQLRVRPDPAARPAHPMLAPVVGCSAGFVSTLAHVGGVLTTLY